MREPSRTAIVGAGGISRLHLEGIGRHRDRVHAAALCDPDLDALAARSREFDIAECSTGLEELIVKARPDAAIVCTPTHVRKDVVIPLLEAGIPALCEKPFAETYAEAAFMVQAAESTGSAAGRQPELSQALHLRSRASHPEGRQTGKAVAPGLGRSRPST